MTPERIAEIRGDLYRDGFSENDCRAFAFELLAEVERLQQKPKRMGDTCARCQRPIYISYLRPDGLVCHSCFLAEMPERT